MEVEEVLTRLSEISIQKWNYKTDALSVSHIGPMAQDFTAAFGVGEDEKRIYAIDTAGVAFAAIQALFQMIRERDSEMKSLRSEVKELRERVRGAL